MHFYGAASGHDAAADGLQTNMNPEAIGMYVMSADLICPTWSIGNAQSRCG